MTLVDLRISQDGPIVNAVVQGEIDMTNTEDLRSQLNAKTPNDALGLVLDLSQVEYMDSAGIHLIHHLREDLRAGGQKLQLVIPVDSAVNTTIRLAGLDWQGEMARTVDDARDAILERRTEPT